MKKVQCNLYNNESEIIKTTDTIKKIDGYFRNINGYDYNLTKISMQEYKYNIDIRLEFENEITLSLVIEK